MSFDFTEVCEQKKTIDNQRCALSVETKKTQEYAEHFAQLVCRLTMDNLSESANDTEKTSDTVVALRFLVQEWIACQTVGSVSQNIRGKASSTKKIVAGKKRKMVSEADDLATALPEKLELTYVESDGLVARNKARKLLKTAVEKNLQKQSGSTGPVDALRCVDSKIDALERSLFEQFYHWHRGCYNRYLAHLIANLERNATVLLARYEPVEIICFLDSGTLAEQTAVGRWREQYRQILSQKLEPRKRTKKGSIECPKCHDKNTDFYKMQTRSADEPETVFVQCFNCDKHFCL